MNIGEKMEKNIVKISSDYITLGQLLKIQSIISSGGMAKWYLSEFPVKVNNEPEQRRGKKLYRGDIIYFINEDIEVTIVEKNRVNEN